MNTAALIELIKGPEFWMTFAFFLVLILAVRPIGRILSQWGRARADEIRAKLDEPVRLRTQAEELLAKYENHTKNRTQEHNEIIRAAESEIDFLQQEADQKLKDRLMRKENETAVRLQMIHDNGIKELKNQMLRAIINRTYEILGKNVRQVNRQQEMDRALERVYASLENHIDLVKK